jgi:hypothetical protein
MPTSQKKNISRSKMQTSQKKIFPEVKYKLVKKNISRSKMQTSQKKILSEVKCKLVKKKYYQK